MAPHHLAHAALQPIERPEPETAAERLAGLPWRGMLVGLVAVGLGGLILAVSGGRFAAGDGAVLGCLAVGALVGGSSARRLADSQARAAGTGQGGWMSVVVATQPPTTPEFAATRPPSRPRSGPERRSLTRVARDRQRPRLLATADTR